MPTGCVRREVGCVVVLRGAGGTLADAAPALAAQTVAAEGLGHEHLASERRHPITVARRLRVAVASHVRRPALIRRPTTSLPCLIDVQERCAIAKMTAQCADKSKQTATPPPKIT